MGVKRRKPARRKRKTKRATGARKKAAGKKRLWVHESWARQIFEHAFWPNKAPPCERCPRRKTKCPRCTAIESCRATYMFNGRRKRWFDFDIVLKVRVPGKTDAAGHPLYRIVVAVEVDGPSHYRSIKKFGGAAGYADQRTRDKCKMRYCEEMGIYLVRIPCYFKDKKTHRLVPRPELFVKCVHAKVWEVRAHLESLGGPAAAALAAHWSPDWHTSPLATPHRPSA